MTDAREIPSRRRTRLIAASVAALLISAAQAQAQQTPYPPPAQPYPGSPTYPNPTYPNPTYPNPTYPNPTYPNSGYPAPQSGYPGNSGYAANGQVNGYPAQMPAQPQSHFFRDLFAGTLAAVLQTVSGGLIASIGGRILDWFTHKSQNSQQAYNPAAGAYPMPGQYPNQSQNGGYGTTNSYPSTSVYPNGYTPPTSGYPNPGYPSPSQGNPSAPYPTNAYPTNEYPNGANPGAAYPNTAYPPVNPAGTVPPYGGATAQPYGAAQPSFYGTATPLVYDARTGQPVTGAANPYATRGVEMENAIYAGIAYEVHAMSADGQLTPINTANYKFHTGDKFMVYYRPSLPGHMEIYNVNPKGQQTLIDSSTMAAGQMVGLGPYQFAKQKGDESLRLILTPCSSPQLVAATRDIVKMDAPPDAAPATPGVRLGSCDVPAPRGLDTRTRDIEKVGLEGTTSFALDPLSVQEMNSGQAAPREVTIVFHHR